MHIRNIFFSFLACYPKPGHYLLHFCLAIMSHWICIKWKCISDLQYVLFTWSRKYSNRSLSSIQKSSYHLQNGIEYTRKEYACVYEARKRRITEASEWQIDNKWRAVNSSACSNCSTCKIKQKIICMFPAQNWMLQNTHTVVIVILRLFWP